MLRSRGMAEPRRGRPPTQSISKPPPPPASAPRSARDAPHHRPRPARLPRRAAGRRRAHRLRGRQHEGAAIAKLSAHAIDVMILGRLQRPAAAPALLRAIRAGDHERIHPAQPVITLGATDELTVLRAYECGSDHHLPDSTGYVLLRAVLASVARRALEKTSSRHVYVGEIQHRPGCPHRRHRRHTGPRQPPGVRAARQVRRRPRPRHRQARARPRHLGPRTDQRTHHRKPLCRLRTRLTDASARAVLINRWGQGWALTTEQ
jgi:hypothetical protein